MNIKLTDGDRISRLVIARYEGSDGTTTKKLISKDYNLTTYDNMKVTATDQQTSSAIVSGISKGTEESVDLLV